MSQNPVATAAQRKAVLAAIDKAERAMLPGGLTAEEMESAAVLADLQYNRLKNSGELRREELAKGIAEQDKWNFWGQP